MKKLFSFYVIFLLLLSISTYAQIDTYIFTQFSGTYTEISGGTLIGEATDLSSNTLDDVNFPAQPLPFSFNFNGNSYTEYNVNTNGYITFGVTLPAPGSPYTPISNTAAYSGALAVMATDLQGCHAFTANRTSGSNVLTNVSSFEGVVAGKRITGPDIGLSVVTIVSFDEAARTVTLSQNAVSSGTAGIYTLASGTIRSETTGAPGSRVHTIQWQNFRRFAGVNENMNFQIKLYEGTDIIEFCYGPFASAIVTNATPQVGLRGAVNSDYATRIGTDWSQTFSGAGNFSVMTLNNVSHPSNGLVFRWTGPQLCNMLITNLSPAGTVFPGCFPLYLAPKVNISNTGTSGAQTGITVTYSVPSESYNETVAVPDLAIGANTDVNFPATLVASSNDPGTKNVTITVNSTCGSAPQVYVQNASYFVSTVNRNFGGPSAGYYFANSTPGASCAIDQPDCNWVDTTGSTSLIVNGFNVAGSLLVGTVDDGYFALGLGEVLGEMKFKYGGVDYDSFYVGTNGMIAFSRKNNSQSQLTTFNPLYIPDANAPRPAIFPFWKDFAFHQLNQSPTNRLSYKVMADQLLITYSNAPNFSSSPVVNDYVSFQVILELKPFPTDDGNIYVQFNKSLTGSVFLTKYNDGSLPSHTVGLQNQNGNSALQYRRSQGSQIIVVPGILFDSSSCLAVGYSTNNSTLPVELSSFVSNVNSREVNLAWSTASELNNAGFDVERKSVSGEWTRIANVAGNGTSNDAHNYSFTDRNVESGKYNYRLKQIDFNGNFTYYNLSNEVNIGVPEKFELSQNYPNPFNPSTTINYDLPFDSKVSIKLFDMSGREVASLVNETKVAGYYSVNFNASTLSSGVYFYRISAEGNGQSFVATKKMMLVK